MNFAFTEEQEALRATARAFLARHSAPDRVRAAMESELGWDPEVWKRIGAELGWPALVVPEAYGGLGLGAVELSALLETMGETLLCAPFFSTVCLGATALLEAGSEAQKREHLPGIAQGRTLATLAWAEAGSAASTAGDDVVGIAATARREGADYVLSGVKRFVPDGHAADLLVVAARAPGSRGEDGVGLFLVEAGAPGLVRRALPTLDRTRRLAEVELREVRVPRAAHLGNGPGGEASAAAALRHTLDRAAIALAAEQVGGAQRCLDLSVAHARQRVQFGRPIGSFQAIQHKCADLMLRVESARSAAYAAACVASEQGAGPRADEGPDLARVASLAKAYCSEAYFSCAAEALQIHGGVGFTWEYDVHLHLKRARAMEGFLGDPAFHRERVARAIGL
jgi:alkylation response protein AidB-like acyl-CoA dehydrogenase